MVYTHKLSASGCFSTLTILPTRKSIIDGLGGRTGAGGAGGAFSFFDLSFLPSFLAAAPSAPAFEVPAGASLLTGAASFLGFFSFGASATRTGLGNVE